MRCGGRATTTRWPASSTTVSAKGGTVEAEGHEPAGEHVDHPLAALEHPEDAFSAYLADGVDQVVCEEKHMGSRAVVVACRDASVPQRRFGIGGPAQGVIYTRTGRPFFASVARASALFLETTR